VSDEARLPRCPLCNGRTEFRLVLDGRRLFRCRARQCGLTFISPQPSEEELKACYSADYYGIGDSRHEETDRHLYEQIANLVLPRVTADRPTVLDYGCARAGLWDVLPRPLQARYFGIEPDESARDEAHGKTGRPIFATIEEYNQARLASWDICIMNQVIEHLRNPAMELQELISTASPAAFLFIATPNCGSAKAMILGRRWPEYANRTHLHFFTQRSCRMLLTRAGFEKIERINSRLRYAKMGFLRRVLQDVLRALKLDGNLTMSARGPSRERGIS